MKRSSLLLLISLSAAVSSPWQTVRAQVTTNTDALPEAPAAAPAKSAPSRAVHGTTASHHSSASQRVGAPPDVPPVPPAPVVIPPPAVTVPTHPPVPPTAVKPVANAESGTTTRPNGLQITFAPQSADMNPETLSAIQTEGKTLASQPTLRVTLLSYASGSGEDKSTPRRTALARALAVRSILINAGVATTRIYPRAIGLLPKDDSGPADRLDLVAEGIVPADPTQASFGTPAAKPASPPVPTKKKAAP